MIGLPTTTTSSTESRRDAGGVDQLAEQLVERAAHGAGELARRRPGSSSRTTPGSSGPRRSGSAGSSARPTGEHLAGGEVAQVAGDGGRADVDRRADDALDGSPATRRRSRRRERPRSPPSRSGGPPRRPGDRASAAPARRSTAVVAVVTATPCCSASGRGQLVGDARDVGSEHRRSELDVVRGHQRVDHERPAGRGPCAPPGGAPGSPRARRSRRRRRCAAAQPSRWPATSGRLPR